IQSALTGYIGDAQRAMEASLATRTLVDVTTDMLDREQRTQRAAHAGG
ncbi:transcriptional regulator, partial [Burkholderia cenocepacia]|nr:transcriptional regulator [Burkholderia cenocepacia]